MFCCASVSDELPVSVALSNSLIQLVRVSGSITSCSPLAWKMSDWLMRSMNKTVF